MGGSRSAIVSDVDVFHGFIKADIRLRDGLLEWIQVNNDQLKRNNPVGLNRGRIGSQCWASQNRTVNLGMQRFNATIHDLRESRVGRDINDRNASLLQKLTSSPGRKNLIAQRHETFHEGLKSGLITDTDERTQRHGRTHEDYDLFDGKRKCR